MYDRGSLGASGDLAPLANLFLPLIGVGDVYYKGRKRGSDQRIGRVRLEACEAEKQGGVSFIERYAIYERQWRIRLDAAFSLSKKADLIAALSLRLSMGVSILSWIVSSRCVRIPDKSRPGPLFDGY